jgi:hypothetical protein
VAAAGLDHFEVGSCLAADVPGRSTQARPTAHAKVQIAVRRAELDRLGLDLGGIEPQIASPYHQAERRKWAKVLFDNATRAE